MFYIISFYDYFNDAVNKTKLTFEQGDLQKSARKMQMKEHKVISNKKVVIKRCMV